MNSILFQGNWGLNHLGPISTKVAPVPRKYEKMAQNPQVGQGYRRTFIAVPF